MATTKSLGETNREQHACTNKKKEKAFISFRCDPVGESEWV